MSREEAVNEIINGDGLVKQDHPFVDDLLFFIMLRDAATEKEWYEVSAFCRNQISHIENKQRLEKLNSDIDNLKNNNWNGVYSPKH